MGFPARGRDVFHRSFSTDHGRVFHTHEGVLRFSQSARSRPRSCTIFEAKRGCAPGIIKNRKRRPPLTSGSWSAVALPSRRNLKKTATAGEVSWLNQPGRWLPQRRAQFSFFSSAKSCELRFLSSLAKITKRTEACKWRIKSEYERFFSHSFHRSVRYSRNDWIHRAFTPWKACELLKEKASACRKSSAGFIL